MGVFDENGGIDTGYYAELLKKDSKSHQVVEIVESEEYIPEESEKDGMKEFLDNNTFKGLPPSAMAAVKKLELEKAEKERNSKQVAQMFSKLFTDLNEKYGLDVQLDFNSFSKSLEFIIQPRNKKALELYLSEAYGRFRVILYAQYLNAISLLSAQILDPNYILSDSLSYGDKLLVMKQLYEFMQSLNEIYKEVNVSDTELKLEKLSEETESTMDIDDPQVRDFLQNLSQNIKSANKQLK